MARVIEHASRRRPAHPLDPASDFGPLSSPARRDRVSAHVQGALRSGAEAALLGGVQQVGGCFAEPTVFVGVAPDAAIALANATDFGLAATVWTTDLGRAARVADAIDAGAVTIRTSCAGNPEPAQALRYEPFKASGIGCEEGLRGLQASARLKWSA